MSKTDGFDSVEPTLEILPKWYLNGAPALEKPSAWIYNLKIDAKLPEYFIFAFRRTSK